MCTSKFLISGLIGVHISSIVKCGYQNNFKPVYFFLGKMLHAQKHSQANINQQNKTKEILNNRGKNLLYSQTSKKVKVACFAFSCFLCMQNLSVKTNRLEIVLIPSFHYTTNLL